MPYIYKFRGLPCSITSDDKLWAVSGRYGQGSGVLEWCYDENDAKEVLARMSKDKCFSGLLAHKFLE